MKIDFLNYDKPVKQELEKLPPMHRVAFAAACCERLWPTYNAFCRRENWGNPALLRKALDEVWQVLQGKSVDAARISELKDDIQQREDICPDYESDRWLCADYLIEAQDAVNAIINTLQACLEPSVEQVYGVGHYASATVESFLVQAEEYAEIFNDAEKQINMLANHPWLTKELAKQSEDLQRLQSTQTLERDFLEWLRTYFDNDGKSNLYIC